MCTFYVFLVTTINSLYEINEMVFNDGKCVLCEIGIELFYMTQTKLTSANPHFCHCGIHEAFLCLSILFISHFYMLQYFLWYKTKTMSRLIWWGPYSVMGKSRVKSWDGSYPHYPHWRLPYFYLVPPENYMVGSQIRLYNRFLQIPLQSVIHWSSYLSTVGNMTF